MDKNSVLEIITPIVTENKLYCIKYLYGDNFLVIMQ